MGLSLIHGVINYMYIYIYNICIYAYFSPPPKNIILASCPCILEEKNRPVSLATPV